MDNKKVTRISKFLSLVLRHEPEAAHVKLDESGWVYVQALLSGCAKAGRQFSLEDLQYIVATNEKKRFEFSPDGLRIRASQGHSVKIDLDYFPQKPPEFLCHGTASQFVGLIFREGLQKGNRHHVHLTEDEKVALQVGGRHGKPALLTIRAGDMHRAGFSFLKSTNGVWLTEHVPAEYIHFP